VQVSQHRFYANPKERETSTDTSVWPVALATVDGIHSFKTKNATIEQLDGKLNFGQFGVFRVHYTEPALTALSEQIDSPVWSNADRMGLLDDAYALARAGIISTDRTLALAAHYSGQTSEAVWGIVSSSLSGIYSAFDDETLTPHFHAYAQQLVEEQYQRLSWNAAQGESEFDTLLRPLVLGIALKYRLPDALAIAKKRFDALV